MSENKDPVEELIRHLKKTVDDENKERAKRRDSSGRPLKPIYFSSKQLEAAGKVYETHQGGAARAMLWGKDTPDNRLLARLIQEADTVGAHIPLKIRAHIIRHFDSIMKEVK
jgi:hypothetical protein